jgi:hypothetical protein
VFPLYWTGTLELMSSDTPLEIQVAEAPWAIDDDDFYLEDDGTNDHCQVCVKNINFNIMLVCDGCNKEVCHVQLQSQKKLK